MKFLLDHDVPVDIAYVLAALGHEVSKLRELAAPTVTDEQVLDLARDSASVLITCIAMTSSR